MAETRKHKLLLISDGLLASLSQDAAFRRQFPFLASIGTAPARRTGCGTCGGSNRQRATVYQAAKKAIAGLSSDKKQIMKRMLDAEQIRIVYVRDDGHTVQLTF